MRPLFVILPPFVVLALVACGARPCARGGDRVAELTDQLEGRCCGYHTEPIEGQIDNLCKAFGPQGAGLRLGAGRHQCAMWAARCLAEMKDAAAPAVPALIAAVEGGLNNYDTGDGVIPARDATLRALGTLGGERAVAPLLEALRHPRAVDVGPGALGYASKEPADETAAIEALGLVGARATAAVPDLASALERPVSSPAEARRFRAAAEALGRIGGDAALLALTAALTEPARAPDVARALGAFGPRAAGAVPQLIALVKSNPDGDGNAQLRRAIREIAGRETWESLPLDYHATMGEMMRWMDRRARGLGCVRGGLHQDGPAETLTHTLAGGVEIRTRFARQTWVARRIVAGDIEVEGVSVVSVRQPFSSLEQWRRLVDEALVSQCGASGPERAPRSGR